MKKNKIIRLQKVLFWMIIIGLEIGAYVSRSNVEYSRYRVEKKYLVTNYRLMDKNGGPAEYVATLPNRSFLRRCLRKNCKPGIAISRLVDHCTGKGKLSMAVQNRADRLRTWGGFLRAIGFIGTVLSGITIVLYVVITDLADQFYWRLPRAIYLFEDYCAEKILIALFIFFIIWWTISCFG